MKGARQKKKLIQTVDSFDYKFIVITKINLFEDIMDKTHVDKISLRFKIITLKVN